MFVVTYLIHVQMIQITVDSMITHKMDSLSEKQKSIIALVKSHFSGQSSSYDV